MMNAIKLCKYLISINQDLIKRTAMSDCHCIGLNSFVINERPRIRLFIAEPHCELFQEFDYKNPIIPIHPHKYEDMFTQLEGVMVNHLYAVGGDIEFNKYHYLRLSDSNVQLELLGTEGLKYLGARTDIIELKSTELHTASLIGSRCSWLITETFEDKNFKQVAYHKNLVERKELYKPMIDSIEYLESYFSDVTTNVDGVVQEFLKTKEHLIESWQKTVLPSGEYGYIVFLHEDTYDNRCEFDDFYYEYMNFDGCFKFIDKKLKDRWVGYNEKIS